MRQQSGWGKWHDGGHTQSDDRLLRATNNVYGYGVNKDVENLPQLRDRMSAMIDNYHNVQQGRGCLAQLSNDAAFFFRQYTVAAG
jgi:hypothetical protein